MTRRQILPLGKWDDVKKLPIIKALSHIQTLWHQYALCFLIITVGSADHSFGTIPFATKSIYFARKLAEFK